MRFFEPLSTKERHATGVGQPAFVFLRATGRRDQQLHRLTTQGESREATWSRTIIDHLHFSRRHRRRRRRRHHRIVHTRIVCSAWRPLEKGAAPLVEVRAVRAEARNLRVEVLRASAHVPKRRDDKVNNVLCFRVGYAVERNVLRSQITEAIQHIARIDTVGHSRRQFVFSVEHRYQPSPYFVCVYVLCE